VKLVFLASSWCHRVSINKDVSLATTFEAILKVGVGKRAAPFPGPPGHGPSTLDFKVRLSERTVSVLSKLLAHV
jgi:hypothetical protein